MVYHTIIDSFPKNPNMYLTTVKFQRITWDYNAYAPKYYWIKFYYDIFSSEL